MGVWNHGAGGGNDGGVVVPTSVTYRSQFDGPAAAPKGDPGQAVDQHKKGLLLSPDNDGHVKREFYNAHASLPMWIRFGGSGDVFPTGAYVATDDWAFPIPAGMAWEEKEWHGNVYGAWPDVPSGAASSITVPGGGWHATLSGPLGLAAAVTVAAGVKTLTTILADVETQLNAAANLAANIHFRVRTLGSSYWYSTRGNDDNSVAPPRTGRVAIWLYSDFGDGDGTTDASPGAFEYEFAFVFTETAFRDALGYTHLTTQHTNGLGSGIATIGSLTPGGSPGTANLLGRTTEMTGSV